MSPFKRTFLICLTSLMIAITESIYPFRSYSLEDLQVLTSLEPNVAGENCNLRGRKIFQLIHGELNIGDKYLGSESFHSYTNYINRQRISLNNENLVITHAMFKYTSMEEKRPTVSLRIIAGGKNHNFVEVEFSSESYRIGVGCSLYGTETLSTITPPYTRTTLRLTTVSSTTGDPISTRLTSTWVPTMSTSPRTTQTTSTSVAPNTTTIPSTTRVPTTSSTWVPTSSTSPRTTQPNSTSVAPNTTTIPSTSRVTTTSSTWVPTSSTSPKTTQPNSTSVAPNTTTIPSTTRVPTTSSTWVPSTSTTKYPQTTEDVIIYDEFDIYVPATDY